MFGGTNKPGWDGQRGVHHEVYLSNRSMRLNEWAELCYDASVAGGWWQWVTELAEAYNEGARKGLMDKHLPDRPAVEVELADELIRIFDYAGRNKLDLDGAVREKLRYNRKRADHQPENRRKEGGKKV